MKNPLLGLLLLLCSAASLQAQVTPAFHFDMEGHRGCRGLYPENTIPAMLHAIDLGVNTIEMDISFTKDLQPILSHDQYFNNAITTLPNGDTLSERAGRSLVLYRMSYDDIRRYDVGMKFNAQFPDQKKIAAVKPRLADVIDSVLLYCNANGKPVPNFNIETKTNPLTDNITHPAPEKFVDLLMKMILSKQIQSKVIIQSFDIRTLQYLHKQYPYIATSLLVMSRTPGSMPDQLKGLGFVPTIYSPEYTMVTQAMVDNCRRQHIRLLPWTVNEVADMQRLRQWGVDGLISDYPDRFQLAFPK